MPLQELSGYIVTDTALLRQEVKDGRRTVGLSTYSFIRIMHGKPLFTVLVLCNAHRSA